VSGLKIEIGFLILIAAVLPIISCDLVYPEVVVVNKTDEGTLLRNLSFSGCKWDTVLGFGEATSPDRCLPGEDQVHFEKFNAAAYDKLGGESPTWFGYQTISKKRVRCGEFHVFEITIGDLEQDFSTPGPYGH
jgi:hypothetical protein